MPAQRLNHKDATFPANLGAALPRMPRALREARRGSGECTPGCSGTDGAWLCPASQPAVSPRSPDLQTEEPRASPRTIPCSARGRMLTRAVRLNNNTLNELTDLGPALELLLENPEELSWLDLSFNDLPTIDPVGAWGMQILVPAPV